MSLLRAETIRRCRRWALAAPLAVLATTAPCTSAYAQGAGLAEALFQDGLKLFEAGSVHAACEKFAESQRLEPANGTLQNLAACHEKDGRTATAWSEWTLLAGRAAAAKQAAREALARKKMTELEPRLFRLRLVIAESARIDAVAIDETELSRGAFGTELPLDPGTHHVTFRARGLAPKTVSVVATEGGRTTLTPPTLEPEGTRSAAVIAPATPAGADATAPSPAPSPASEPTTTPLRIASYVALGLGGAGLVVGGVFGGLAMSAKGELAGHCQGPQCDADGLAANDQAHARATVSTIAFVAGGALAATGVVLFVLGKPNASATIAIAPGTATLRGSF